MCLKVSARPVKACASFLSSRKVNKNRAMKIREAIKNKGVHCILALLSLFVLRFVNLGERRMGGETVQASPKNAEGVQKHLHAFRNFMLTV